MKIVSWNVNGLRAAHKKGFLEWIASEKPDILCVQETKAAQAQLPEALQNVRGYRAYFAEAKKRGYSGVALWSKQEPKKVEMSLGNRKFDVEGRVIKVDYPGFVLFNVYFPNGKVSKERLRFKMDFYGAFLKKVKALKKNVIVCGDVNTAHKEIDLARPKENETVSGFLPQERAWIDKFIASGFVDAFRLFNQQPSQYTWWDLKTRARERNVGWRIDYFFISAKLKKNLKSAFIRSNVRGSDHCPIGIEITL